MNTINLSPKISVVKSETPVIKSKKVAFICEEYSDFRYHANNIFPNLELDYDLTFFFVNSIEDVRGLVFDCYYTPRELGVKSQKALDYLKFRLVKEFEL